MRILILGKNTILSEILPSYLKDNKLEIGNISGSSKSILTKMDRFEIENCLVINLVNDPFIGLGNDYDTNIDLIKFFLNKEIKVITPITYPFHQKKDYQRYISDLKNISDENFTLIISDLIGKSSDDNTGYFNKVTKSDHESKITSSESHLFNGVTSYDMSKLILSLINDWSNFPRTLLPYTEDFSEYELCNILNEFFNDKNLYNKNVKIYKRNTNEKRNLIEGNLNRGSIRDQIKEYREDRFPKIKTWKYE